ncbi:hypothetical protein E3N88_00290 [Mikania micrantha]|uniref:Uncharacterized protein n=1 Tax=Mikania micrantha TaxID=192012 RepID=A0A5N6PXM3_9ASTR|nr:hypothetical protein E3N88_00290 [Mikania micrantha]
MPSLVVQIPSLVVQIQSQTSSSTTIRVEFGKIMSSPSRFHRYLHAISPQNPNRYLCSHRFIARYSARYSASMDPIDKHDLDFYNNRTIRRLRRRVAPGTVEAVIRPVAHALTQPTTGPNHRAVARCVSPRRPDDDPPGPSRRTGPKTRRTGRRYAATTPRAARSGASHDKRVVIAAAATPRVPGIESARAPASNHRPEAAPAPAAAATPARRRPGRPKTVVRLIQ